MELNVRQLPHEFPRKFVPAEAQLGEWSQVEPLFHQLERAPLETPEQVEGWLERRSELEACLQQEGSARRIRMSQQTDDPERERSFLHFIREVQPRAKAAFQRLDERFLAAPGAADLPQERYAVLKRAVRNRVELFRRENLPLETEEQELGQHYQRLTGKLTVTFQGQERTLPQLAKFLEDPDRATRAGAWRLAAERRLRERDRLEDLYDQLLNNREQQAHNAGFPDYRAYVFRKYERFDYGPEDCLRFHEAVEQHVIPLARQLSARRAQLLGLEALRPWDLEVDPQGRPPLRAFETAEQLIAGAAEVFRALDRELGSTFERMRQLNLLDLDNRKGKAPGGYQATLAEARLPFIFMNAVGRAADLRTLLHEGGHAFHSMLCRQEPLTFYRGHPIEFAEVASMGMELLSRPYWDRFYQGEDLRRAWSDHLRGIVTLLPWVATIDAFQHWIYTHPGHTREERRALWLSLLERFNVGVSHHGLEELVAHRWQAQLHLFLVPFYYIEYGIAQLGALQVWQNAQADPQAALRSYKRGLSLGYQRPLPQLFEAAGIALDFGPQRVGALMRGMEAELRSLGALFGEEHDNMGS